MILIQILNIIIHLIYKKIKKKELFPDIVHSHGELFLLSYLHYQLTETSPDQPRPGSRVGGHSIHIIIHISAGNSVEP